MAQLVDVECLGGGTRIPITDHPIRLIGTILEVTPALESDTVVSTATSIHHVKFLMTTEGVLLALDAIGLIGAVPVILTTFEAYSVNT
jgi:hypothetical protein